MRFVRWLLLPIYLVTSSLLHVWLFRSEPRCHRDAMGFSGNNLVHVLDRGTIPLYELKRGDLVQVRGKHGPSSTQSTRVYAIALWNEPTECLSFHLMTKNSPKLEVTPSQLLFVYQGNAKRSVPARNVTHALITQTGQTIPVERKRRKVTRRGRYVPLTSTGELILNGIQASCYMDTPMHLYPEVMHLYLAPYRVYESWSPLPIVSPENYLEQLTCLDSRVMLVLFPYVCFTYGLELILQSRQSFLFAIVLTGLLWAWRNMKQHAKQRKKAGGSRKQIK